MEKCSCCEEDIEIANRKWLMQQHNHNIPKNINTGIIYEWVEARIDKLMNGLDREEAEYVLSLIVRDKWEE